MQSFHVKLQPPVHCFAVCASNLDRIIFSCGNSWSHQVSLGNVTHAIQFVSSFNPELSENPVMLKTESATLIVIVIVLSHIPSILSLLHSMRSTVLYVHI